MGRAPGFRRTNTAAPNLVPPQPPIVTCSATVEPTDLALVVDNAYPYAGCVFFVGVENTGTGQAIHVNLGSLDSSADVSCDVAGCQASDLDIVGGGSSSAIATELCRMTGAVSQDDLTYTLEVGATLTCPFFVTVLQPAKEGAHYTVRITPPALDTQQEDPTATPTSELTETGNTQLNNIPRPAPTATSTSRPSATATPTSKPTGLTPTSVVRGVRTPGPPATGSGKLVQRPGGSAGNSTVTWMAALLLAAVAIGGIWRRAIEIAPIELPTVSRLPFR